MTAQFRDATEADLLAIVRLLADDPLGATRETTGPGVAEAYREAFRQIAAQAGNHVIVAVDPSDTVIGCLQLTFTPGLARGGMTRATIEGVRVHRAHRGQGLGRALIQHAMDRAREAACGLIQLTTDKSRPEAISFYERLGFTASHEGMKRTLTD